MQIDYFNVWLQSMQCRGCLCVNRSECSGSEGDRGGASVALSIVTKNSDLEHLDGILLEFNYCQPLMHFISNLFSQQDLIKLENWRIKSVKKIFIHWGFMMNLKVNCVRKLRQMDDLFCTRPR